MENEIVITDEYILENLKIKLAELIKEKEELVPKLNSLNYKIQHCAHAVKLYEQLNIEPTVQECDTSKAK